jgi:hypothetical protein
MKHSGLQKSISSIFDGTEPIKQETTTTVATATPQSPVAVAPSKPQPATPIVTPHVTVNASPLAVATSQTPPTGSAVPQSTVSQPARLTSRPRPVPKKNSDCRNTISIKDLWKTLKTRFTSSPKAAIDPQQKKTAILVAILGIVFVVVLLFVLGTSPSGVKAALKSGTDVSSSNSNSANIENWQKPEIYPLSLRDPMKPSSNSAGNPQAGGEMTVRGIVYSSDKPSAIIADQIVSEGDVILGVKIIKIGKDFVAFEKDGKRWQQQVRQ